MTLRTVKKAVITIAALAITINASAQTSSTDCTLPKVRQEKILQNFRASLKSDCLGIVEGTIYNVVVFKKYYPGLDYSPLLTELNRSAQANEDASVRFKAHLAAMYLTDDSGLEIVPLARPSDHEYLFRQIVQQLEKKFLVTN
jgi:hypothetical protein